MKKIPELGISAYPWGLTTQYPSVLDKNGDIVCDLTERAEWCENANLIRQSPVLFDCLHEAVVEWCQNCKCNTHDDSYECALESEKCFVQRWRKALEDAEWSPDYREDHA